MRMQRKAQQAAHRVEALQLIVGGPLPITVRQLVPLSASILGLIWVCEGNMGRWVGVEVWVGVKGDEGLIQQI